MLRMLRFQSLCRVTLGLWMILVAGVPRVAAVEYPERHALVGATAFLPCNITPPTADDAVALVLWYRGDSGTPIFSLDARNSPPDPERTFVDDSLGSRAVFNRSGPMAMLRLQPVKDVDDGEYRCRVDYKRSRTQNRLVRLNVVVPPAEVIIANKTGEPLVNRPIIGPFNEGSSLILVCKALGGRPPPRVTWWLGPQMVDDTDSALGEGIVRNDLVISKLKRTDLMATYRCQASNNNDTVPISTSVSLDLNLRPLVVQIVTPRTGLIDGQLVDIECQAEGAQPQADITWLLDGQPYNESRSTLAADASRTSSILHLEAKPELNGKRISCKGFNPHLPDSDLQDHWLLNIKFKPTLQLNMVTTTPNDQIGEGSSVYFDCNVQANPPVLEVGWLHEGSQLSPGPGVRLEPVHLVIDHVRRHQRGNYQCAATNELGHGVSEKVFLMVYYAPKCREKQKMTYHVAKHETMRVSCEVDADPSDVRFEWQFNNSQETLDLVAFNQTGSKTSSAFYTPRRRADYGKLICIASNSIGKSAHPCIFNIVPAAPPLPLVSCAVPGQSEQSLRISCSTSSEEESSLPVQYMAEVYREGKFTKRIVSQVPEFLVEGLAPGATFTVLVHAWNEKGRSPSHTVVASTLPSSKPLPRGEAAIVSAPSPLLGTLLGVVALLVIIAMVIIIVMKVKTGKRVQAAKRQQDDKADTPLKKELGDITEVEDKCPDIIPPKNIGFGPDFTDIELKYVDTHITDRIPAYENVPEKSYKEAYGTTIGPNCYGAKQCEEDLTYAELSLPPSTHSTFARSGRRVSGTYRAPMGAVSPLPQPQEPPTEYADIDFTATRAHASMAEARTRASESDVPHQVRATTPLVSAVCSRVCVTPPLRPSWKPPPSRLSMSSLGISRSDAGSSFVPTWTLSDAGSSGGTLPMC
ncbi:hemicentin-2-like isoform X2 [Ornithodoros turicata]|uniref:hemicentin-2-like isoform X2 n=1 Tax=Ornithodoros turicata TaxID=34597 RepID=UPI0031389FE5